MDVEPPEWMSGLSSPVSSDYEDAETTFRGHGNGRSGAVMGVGRMMTPADSQEVSFTYSNLSILYSLD